MSLCNRCTLDGFESDAKSRGATVEVVQLGHNRGTLVGWYEVIASDRPEPDLWFKSLTTGCAC